MLKREMESRSDSDSDTDLNPNPNPNDSNDQSQVTSHLSDTEDILTYHKKSDSQKADSSKSKGK